MWAHLISHDLWLEEGADLLRIKQRRGTKFRDPTERNPQSGGIVVLFIEISIEYSSYN